eukprot:gene27571-biopygen11495
MAAHRQASSSLPQSVADEVGSLTVRPGECRIAIRRSPPGKSPGPDGIPIELYRTFADSFTPLLCRLYSAMGTKGLLPPEFLEGSLIILGKGGDKLDAGNYRPITLVNTDYRILAKVLANRLGPVMNRIISPEQSAFLPCRQIGDAILFLQLLPELLKSQNKSGVLAFLDFRKAYNTLDRAFLFQCLEVAGLGGGFLTWVRLLLSSTATRAMVNGFRSRAFEFLAGVRQGDPLSPLLFLFAMQALQHWLLHKNIGMYIKPGSPCTGCKYADDTIVLLRSLDPAQLQAFLTCLTFFGQASGLYLNHLKSKLLPIGVPHPLPLPVQILGFPVVAEATTLGVSFTNGSPTCPPMTPQWSERLAHVERCFSRLAKLPLSSFGRGFSSSSYGLSTLLYHAEFGGIPQEVVNDLQCLTTKLVDRGLGPADKARVLPGVPSALLTGSPCQGGLGVMPWQHHITSRHAMWGVRLFRGLARGLQPWSPLWLLVAQELLLHLMPQSMASQPPALAFLHASRDITHFKTSAGAQGLPHGPLRRMAMGFAAISATAGPLRDVTYRPLELGPWCHQAPLWGNPFLTAPLPSTPGAVLNAPPCVSYGTFLDDVFYRLMQIPSLVCVADATLFLARHGAAVSSAETARRDWLHAQERPCPLLTKLERPPPASRLVPSLRAPSGGLVTGPSIPNVVGAYWASVSSVPPSAYPAAQEEVMAAHRQASSSLPQSVADEVGSLTVRPGECRIAIRRSPPGKSPGPDGIPIELYRTFADSFTPLLCRLYSAMGTKGLLPPEFLEGSLIILGKGGDKLDAGNYRPITLVNTDYRILAKVLANRLGPVMNRIISPEQSAFLPCRQIGDAILFLQLLPELLKSQNKSGVLAFLDFRKAYNTLDRAFLFQCLEVAGLGGGFLTWVRLLLSSTATRAMVNGFRSRAFEFLAGVRQGDPLSPLLFLFAMQALQHWLLHKNIGMYIKPGSPCTGCKYADDTIVLLRSLDPAQLQAFLTCLTFFGQASGLYLNHLKSKLLPIGVPHPLPLPVQILGFPVVAEATTLGVSFTNGSPTCPPMTPQWSERLAHVERCFSRLAKLPLSSFGRGFSSSSYGLSTLLYHAEFGGIPQEVVNDLQCLTTKLVDRGLGPADKARVLPGVPSALLTGSPCQGGLGVMPWQHHITSRHAMWGVRLFRGLARGLQPWSPLWLLVAQELLLHLMPQSMASQPPALAFLHASRDITHFKTSAGAQGLPHGPLRRMAMGFAAISATAGPLRDVTYRPLELGPWCHQAPLWGNPFLTAPLPSTPGAVLNAPPCVSYGTFLDDVFYRLMQIPSLVCVADAVRISSSLSDALAECTRQHWTGDQRRQYCSTSVWHPELGRVGLSTMPFGMLNTLFLARHGAAVSSAETARRDWLHAQERPCPLLTKLERPPPASRLVPSLRAPSGGLVTGPSIPNVVGAYWASVSSVPPSAYPAAQEEVMAAHRQASSSLPQSVADEVGSLTVRPGECRIAIRRSPPGKSPGPDGIPIELYRTFADSFTPLLCRLYSAMGTKGLLPPEFLEGSLIILGKGGDKLDAGNYRPITLVNTDYRILAKVLANRLGPVMNRIISPEQSAFLPCRQIGDAILFLQLLPELLKSQNKSGVLAFLDFRKAYNTLDRAFLFQCLEVAGLGGGFLTWVRLLLSSTATRAMVNGFRSRAFEFLAGVRQGDPLSPLLFLFAMQALQHWLLHKNIGMYIKPGSPCTGCKYADDTIVLLRSLDPAQLQAFLTCLTFFGQASGLYLNHLKSKLLPIGVPHPLPLPVQILGFPVVAEATTLGVSFTNGSPTCPPMTPQWSERLAHVERCFSRLAKLPLSSFGRGFSSSSYGLSTLLYHAEFGGIPQEVVNDLQCLTTKLVDRGLGPADKARVLPGVPSALLTGSPCQGGLGVMPWQHHITSRHAMWGVRLFRGLARGLQPWSPLWLLVAQELLLHLMPQSMASQPPALAFLHASRDITHFKTSAGAQGLPHGPLRRMAMGFAAISATAGPLRDVTYRPLELGPWCHQAPLWGNPFLTAPLPSTPGAVLNAPPCVSYGTFLDDVFYRLMQIPSLVCVADAVRISSSLSDALAECTRQHWTGDQRRQYCSTSVWHPELGRVGLSTMPFGMLNTLFLARHGAAVSSAETARRDWLHAQERPCPLLTKLERPPPASRLVPSLRAPSGGLVTGPSIPNVVGAYWASVSSVPPSAYPAAQEEVMAAHRQASSSLPQSVADEVGSLTVRPGECRIAIRRSPPGKSPGPDGIPIELYRTFADSFTPLLCRLYSAMGTKGLLPPEFLEGSLIILGKGGDKLDAGNYRPITLVNTDYRILAKVLANRLGPVMNRIISPEQSAFLPCRQIGDAILFLQLLPELLKSQNKSGVLAFLDFRKAYNTLDRAFLFQCLEVAGLGGGFLTWVRLLLSSTATRAMVNGFRSRAFEFLAGVRQGDPLSPLLFLFAMQALQHWLLHKNIGMYIKPGSPCTGCKYADDTIVLLRSLDPAQLQAFLTCLTFFGQASGLYLNHLKSKLLPIGVPHPLPLPVQILGFPVVAEATTLGVSFTNGSPTCPPMTPQWSERLAHVERCFSRLAKLPLSSFGRGFSSSSYGLSTLLYHAEFGGIPQEVVNDLQCLTTKLVDRGLGPADKARVLPGVPSALLTGSPCQGGLGVMPWQHHITSRHAMWGVRLFRGLARGLQPWSPLWLLVAQELLLHLMPQSMASQPPALAFLHASRDITHFKTSAGAQGLPHGPLRRMAMGFAAISATAGPLRDVTYRPLELGPWCHQAPLWGNPFLTAPLPSTPGAVLNAPPCVSYGTFLDDVFYRLMQIPSLVCVADAVRISSSLSDALAECTRQHWTGDQRRQYCSTSVWHPELGRVGLSTMPFGMLNTLFLARHGAAVSSAETARRDWLHAQERPCPLLTKLERPPPASRLVPSLRAPSGGLVTGPSIPNVVGAYWASVSSVPPSAYPAAQEEVMAAHRQASSSLPQSVADEVGSLTVRPGECRIAIRRSPPGKSPGPDGIPIELYRTFADSFTPLLCRLYSAMGTKGLLPPEFLEGSLIILGKGGDKLDAGNYRPITLVNTDYRILAKVLANRLGPVMNRIISPEQSAFLPCRQIGDAILFLQLLPELLKSQNKSGVLAFLDFRKAYNTLDRAFLFQCLEVAGLGGGFLTWVRLLLSSTATRAMVNGFRSRAFEFLAGVRQGDPLSPLLFLFAMQALQHWLLHKNIGMYIKPGSPCTGCKYADDTIVLLRSLDPAQLQAFLTCLTFFGQASGLYLNHLKSKLLPIGVPHPLPLPVQILGFPVVAEATTLGVSFTNGSPTCPPMTPQWSERLAHVERCFSRLAKLPLSSFGRGFSSSSYGLSTLLYHAEFGGIPQEVVNDLQCLTTKLVDRGLGPADKARVLPGVPSALLTGSPCQGGLGVMPWQHHITSRHAMWGVRLFRGLARGLQPWSPLWLLVAQELLLHLMPQSMASQPPALAFLHASRDITHFKTSAGAQGLPHGPLRRMAMGFAAISATAGPLRDVTYRPLELGPWCHQAPLWGNPFLTAPLPSTPGAVLNAPPCVSYGTFLDDVFYRLMQIPSLVCVADAEEVMAAHRQASSSLPQSVADEVGSLTVRPDYRILAKVLANRLGPVMNRIISPEQSAFLPCRQIGDAILFLQLLPELLKSQNKSGVLAFLDFRKAYNTLDRAFLFQCLEVAGLGGGFLTWILGFPVVAEATTLGVSFTNGSPTCPPMTPQWSERLAHVERCFSRLAKLPLSSFGRGFSSSSYGLSTLLYHAEFGGIPQEVVNDLQCLTTKLVDRGLGPADKARVLPGVPSALLTGSPCQGGLGVMPWQHHITSRHAMWGVRLFRGLARGLQPWSPLWLLVAQELLLHLMPQSMASQPPALAFLHASRDITHFKTSAGAQGLPHGPLRRMAMGFAAISATAGPLRDVTYRPLELGPWCHQAPLWGNPFLTAPLPSTPGAVLNAPPCVSYGTFLDDVFYRLMQIPSLVCVADAVRISSSLSDALAECTRQHWTGDQRRQYCSTSVWHPELGRVGLSTMPFGMLNEEVMAAHRQASSSLPQSVADEIGDAILFLQLLPELLKSQNKSGVLAFLDFRKAYNTLDRAFLFQCLEVAGLGGGFLTWVRLLLSSTATRAMVNGFRSRAFEFLAGVRQGDPLSPLLFLFAMQALQHWLLHKNIGMYIKPGSPCTGCKYADDTIVLLRSLDPAQLQAFLTCLTFFGQASGLYLNHLKSKLLPIGVPHPLPLPVQILGFPVVAEATTLGVSFTNGSPTCPPMTPQWSERLAHVERCFSRLAKLPLSSFGRGFSSSSYGLSTLLYHAEFGGIPQEVVNDLQCLTTKLVDRGLGPADKARVLPGVPSALLTGSPCQGGLVSCPGSTILPADMLCGEFAFSEVLREAPAMVAFVASCSPRASPSSHASVHGLPASGASVPTCF